MKTTTMVILDNLRSAQNVGSIFRTAEAAGVSQIYLIGYTPTPFDHFKRINKMIAKTALGAEKIVPWKTIKRVAPLLKKLKKEGWQIVAVEQDSRAIDYRKFKPISRCAFIFGNEVAGLPKTLLAKCDQIIEIPMAGQKESLNVSVAAGIILFQSGK